MIAVVTGASSGIGRELAHVFEANGFEVIGVGETDFDLATPEGSRRSTRASPAQSKCSPSTPGSRSAETSSRAISTRICA